MIVIEFIGTPGSGKTSLLPAVKCWAEEQGFRTYTVTEAARIFTRRTLPGYMIDHLIPQPLRWPLLWQVFYQYSVLYRVRFFLKYPKLVRQVLKSQWKRPNQADLKRQRVFHWFFYLIGSYEFFIHYARPDEALILDEGFIHRVVQFNASDGEEPVHERIKAYIDLLPKPDLVIFVNACTSTCERRVLDRGIWKFFNHKKPEEISTFVRNSDLVVKTSVEYIKTKGWTVIEAGNDGDNLSTSLEGLHAKLARTSLDRTPTKDLIRTDFKLT